ncbi:uncharacterized protein LOC142934580 [Anarhichas minor]|uniref:uncharacterized protein LOC142934580 n=1 Tax=Anarhichas minor TaxID=65739 RepID=UPI003F73366D
MEKLTGLCVLLAALSLAVTADKFFTEGGNLTLDASPPYPDLIIIIVWKFRGDLLAEWIKDKVPVEFSRSFNGRTTLDTKTGRLVINSMSQADTGVYSVEINNKVQSVSYTAKWIKSVPQPVVVIKPWGHGYYTEVCIVSCDGDTTEAEPVTYSWKIGDRELLGKDIKITVIKNRRDKFITCRMTNPLSEKVSETMISPLYRGDEPVPSFVWIMCGVFVVLVAVAAGVVVGVWMCVAMCVFKICSFQN